MLFSGLFKKKKNESVYPPADLSVLKVDMHSHLIPGIDDGSQSMQETIDMLRRFAQLGYKKVITTPHTMVDYYNNSTSDLLRGRDLVLKQMEKEDIAIELEVASEYFLDENFLQRIKDKDLLTFGDGYVLFEMTFVNESPYLGQAVFDLQLSGYKPVLAHVERYGYWNGNHEKYHDLFDKGVILQMNLNSMNGYYAPEVKKASEYLIEKNLIRFLGSDCHRMEHLDVLEHHLAEPNLHHLLQSNSLLNNTL